MGNNLFGADIAGKLNSLRAPLLGDQCQLTYYLRTTGTRDSNDPSAGTGLATAVPIDGVGFMTTKTRILPSSRLKAGDSVINVFGDSLEGGTVEPVPNGVITLEGRLYVISEVGRDPDAAIYECICRG